VQAEEQRLTQAAAALTSRPERSEAPPAEVPQPRAPGEPSESPSEDLFSGQFASLRQYVTPPPK
jgi:hypothetical protein